MSEGKKHEVAIAQRRFKLDSLCGIIRAWTIPVREGDGFKSCVDPSALVMLLRLPLRFKFQEDHGGWSIGQHVVALNVEFESPLRCATRFCVRSDEVVQQQQHVSLVDLPVHKIVGLNKREGLEKTDIFY